MPQITNIETEIELESGDSADFAPRQHASPAPAPRRLDSTLWMLLGFASITLGVGLTVAPSYSWTASKIAAQLAQFGLQAGVAVFGGLMLMGLATVRRAQESARVEMQYDSSLLLEQIASEMVEIRAGVDAMQDRSNGLEQRVRALEPQLAEARDTILSQVASQAPRNDSDALFQLASGLDKLGLRLEQRLRLHHSTLQESVDELAATVEHARRSLEDRLDQFGGTTQGMVEASGAGAPFAEHAPGGELDGVEGFPPLAPASETGADDTNSLGLLDQFEDVASALPTSHSRPSAAPAAEVGSFGLEGDALETLERAARHTQAANAAGGTWDEQLMVQRDDDTQQKLAQLESLLSDERLRAALDAMRRQA